MFKNTTLEIKDVDTTKRIVVGYFSAFGNKDSDGDVIVKGAFKKTISENKDRIAHLLQHDITKPVGKLLKLEEDEKGLRFESKMSQSTLGNDTLIQYQEGILREHSIGFNTLKEQKREDYNEIQEVKLWEGSTVTFGANSLTPVEAIKDESQRKSEIETRINTIGAFLRKANVSDESFRLLEFEFERLKNILTLQVNEPHPHSVTKKPSFDYSKFVELLKA